MLVMYMMILLPRHFIQMKRCIFSNVPFFFVTWCNVLWHRCGLMPQVRFFSPSVWDLVAWWPLPATIASTIISTGMESHVQCLNADVEQLWNMNKIYLIHCLFQRHPGGCYRKLRDKFLCWVCNLLYPGSHGWKIGSRGWWCGLFRWENKDEKLKCLSESMKGVEGLVHGGVLLSILSHIVGKLGVGVGDVTSLGYKLLCGDDCISEWMHEWVGRTCMCEWLSDSLSFHSLLHSWQSWCDSLGKKATIHMHQVTTMLATSKNTCNFQVIIQPPANHQCWWPDTLNIARAPVRVIIKVSGHQHQLLASGYDLKIRLFRGG